MAHTTVVTGDITVDWMLAKLPATIAEPRWSSETKAKTFRQAGGAALLAKLIHADAARLAQERTDGSWDVHGPKLTTDLLVRDDGSRYDAGCDHGFSIWQPFRVSGESKKKRTIWGVSEFLGLDDRQTSSDCARLGQDPVDPDLVVLVDAGLGFRDAPERGTGPDWPQAITAKDADPKQIILRLTYAKPEGALWDYLVERWPDRLVAVTSVRDLRRERAQISKQLSWERTARETIREIVSCRSHFGRCAWTAVALGHSGAVLVPGEPNAGSEAQLVFEPGCMEGERERHLEWKMLGGSSCAVAALAHQMLVGAVGPETMRAGLRLGLAARRRLHEVGYGDRSATSDRFPTALEFPFAAIVDVLHDGTAPSETDLAEISIGIDDARDGAWTILEQRYPLPTSPQRGTPERSTGATLAKVAERVVKTGVKSSLVGVPVLECEKLVTVDRNEIEAVRSVERLIADYCDPSTRESTPLCIAVFGPPGSGKSFAVKEVAEHALPDQIKPIEFNLSQFEKPHDLLEALHRVRDVRLSGKTPLVIWDEFDTSLQGDPLGWLRYFLQPMQDGTFQQGEITHPIGECIFVFAGGTAHRMTEFKEKYGHEDAKKVPDFESRLHGFMDVLGPNRHTTREPGDPERENDDPYFIIRRAVILRSILDRFCPQLKQGERVLIDDGVLNAFLRAEKYEHGVRSMMAIVRMSILAGAKSFEISSLPPEEQLDMHVTEDFLDLAHCR